MFLKNLKIENNNVLIRSIPFHKGINLVVDETKSSDKKESGNNVGKTTVLRLIDFCLGGSGDNIYKDTEFKDKVNAKIEEFLKDNNVIITLTLAEDLDQSHSSRIITIRKNFLTYSKKIQEINGENYNDKDFVKKLKELIFNSLNDKPAFRQIISKNIRDEKNKLVHTLKVLHPSTKFEEYEALYLFWLGIDLNKNDRKQKLQRDKTTEENLQRMLRRESTLPQIIQSLLIIERTISDLNRKKNLYNLNENYKKDLAELNETKYTINALSTKLSRLEFRKELIIESKNDLEKEVSKIDYKQVKNLYEEAKMLVPTLQKSFEDTLQFHNQMVAKKIKYITKELPDLDSELKIIKKDLDANLDKEKKITTEIRKIGVDQDLQQILSKLNSEHETKGKLDEQKRLWEKTNATLKLINDELEEINAGISSMDDLISNRITEFNKFFSNISNRLDGEQFVLSQDKKEKGYDLTITDIIGNPGTGKKKGQIAAFDLAYIQFAETFNINCLHFILHDQIENVDDNQISTLLIDIVREINCQYVLPVLRDKLPNDINVDKYKVLSLSQSDKLFKL